MPAKVQADLQFFDPRTTHNHFTLDHFYDKATDSYLSLCLFNLVPSCYACNSKFKGSGKLYDKDARNSSPSSTEYSFHDDVTFKLLYHHRRINFKTVKDFNVELDFSKNTLSHEAYVTQLKIRGRYIFYKKEVLRLMQLKEKYPESKIQEMAKAVKMPVDEIRKQVYGSELFESAYDYAPLIKYKRDIARNIKLIP